MINYKIIIKVVGVLLFMLGAAMLLATPFCIYYDQGDLMPIVQSALVSFVCGGLFWFIAKNSQPDIGKREGYLIVALGWLSISVFSSLPYFFSGVLPEWTNAFFESVSGLTTTGATVINDLEEVPAGILFWRSLSQWIGGMGIIVLTVAIFPLLGIGGVELFVAEAPGPTSDKLHPRIKETAKRLWFIYFCLTTILIVLLSISGMGFYDAINHGLTTMATGGFSTKNDSIAYFQNPSIHYILSIFMFIAGCNYTLIYFFYKRKFRRVWNSDEFKTYCILVLLISIGITGVIYGLTDYNLEASFRLSIFQILSIITTTGYVITDYTTLAPVVTLLFFALLFCGACAGSTSGSIKIIRHLVFFKNSFFELKRLLHPKAIIRTKIDSHVVAPKILTHIMVFLLLYLMLFFIGSFSMSIILSDFEQPLLTSAGAVATTLGNVGPSIGLLGPMDTFAEIPVAGKWLSILLMILGRLELFTVLILFTPYFWKNN